MRARSDKPRPRARDLGIPLGALAPGKHNGITDVPGVRVGQVTLYEGVDVRTGVTAILPHPGNVFQQKAPAGLAIANGFGKLAGATQVRELGELETPIVLTNTLCVSRGIEGLVDWTLSQPGNGAVGSVNAFVGETNDGRLNAIRRRAVTSDHVLAAITQASSGPVSEGVVGAGTGTVAFGIKGGIGTSSRVVPFGDVSYVVGVLVQTNYGGALRIGGVALEPEAYLGRGTCLPDSDGSIMIVIATDAPLCDRNLERLAWRAFAGLARTGSDFSNGSGDYSIAFSTHEDVRRTPDMRRQVSPALHVPNELLTPLFRASADATEEAIYNSLLQADPVETIDWRTGQAAYVDALDPETLLRIMKASPSRSWPREAP